MYLVFCVNVGAPLQEQLHDVSMPARRRLVQGSPVLRSGEARRSGHPAGHTPQARSARVYLVRDVNICAGIQQRSNSAAVATTRGRNHLRGGHRSYVTRTGTRCWIDTAGWRRAREHKTNDINSAVQTHKIGRR